VMPLVGGCTQGRARLVLRVARPAPAAAAATRACPISLEQLPSCVLCAVFWLEQTLRPCRRRACCNPTSVVKRSQTQVHVTPTTPNPKLPRGSGKANAQPSLPLARHRGLLSTPALGVHRLTLQPAHPPTHHTPAMPRPPPAPRHPTTRGQQPATAPAPPPFHAQECAG
jgi:hypothetical protein